MTCGCFNYFGVNWQMKIQTIIHYRQLHQLFNPQHGNRTNKITQKMLLSISRLGFWSAILLTLVRRRLNYKENNPLRFKVTQEIVLQEIQSFYLRSETKYFHSVWKYHSQFCPIISYPTNPMIPILCHPIQTRFCPISYDIHYFVSIVKWPL